MRKWALILGATLMFSSLCGCGDKKGDLTDELAKVKGETTVTESTEPEASSETESSTEEKKTNNNLPAKFDLVEDGKLPAFQRAGSTGLNWAFSTIKSIESNIVLNELASVDELNLSEGFLCYYLFPFSEDRMPGSTEDGAYILGNKSNNLTLPYYMGGSPSMAAAILANGVGPVSEEVAPIDTQAGNVQKSAELFMTLENEGKLNKYRGDYLLKEFNLYEDCTMDEVKQHIMENGAMSVYMYADWNGINRTDDDVFTYYYGAEKEGGWQQNLKAEDYLITLVGWDDSFSKDLFGRKIPEHNGAWHAVDDDHNFWISYDEDLSGFNNFIMVERSDYGKILFYDSFGCQDFIKNEHEDTKVANVFKLDEENELKAVGIMTGDKEQEVQIKIYRNCSEGQPEMGECIAELNKTIDYTGYHVIDLDTPAKLYEGDNFSIVVTYKNTGAEKSGVAPIEGDDSEKANDVAEIYLASGKGESFVFVHNQWLDMSEEATAEAFGKTGVLNNACIKALLKY